MNYKQTIDNLITSRYDHLLECSKNILKDNKQVEPVELLSELTIYLYSNRDKVAEYIVLDRLEAFCVSWLTIQGRYTTSPTNKKYQSKEYSLDDSTPTPTTEPIYFTDESEYENDLASIYTPEQIQKILSVNNILDQLTKTEQILFNAYFIENLSYDKIRVKYSFYKEKDNKRITYKSKNAIYHMMKALKEKIHTLINL